MPGAVWQQHPAQRLPTLREALSGLHWASEHQEEEGGWVSADHHEGLRQAWPGVRYAARYVVQGKRDGK